MEKDEIYDAIREHKAYDLVACNYYMLGSDTLKDMLLEYIYAFEKLTLLENDYKAEDIAEELKSRWGE